MPTAHLQLRSKLADPRQIISVGTGARTGMYVPQTPGYINMLGATMPRNPRALEINGTPTVVSKEALRAAPPLVKNQLGDLIDKGALEVVDDPGGANTVLTADQVRTL